MVQKPTHQIPQSDSTLASARSQPLLLHDATLPRMEEKVLAAQPKGLLKPLRSRWDELSIKAKATALAVTLGVAPVLAVGGMAIYFANQMITEETLAERQRLAVSISLQLSQFIQTRLNDVEAIARAPVATNANLRDTASSKVVKAYLDAYIERDSTYEEIAAISPEGAYSFVGNNRTISNLFKTTKGTLNPEAYAPGAKPFAEASAPYYVAVQNSQKPVIIPLQASAQTGASSFYVAAPSFDAASGKLASIIYSRTDNAEIARTANEFLINLLHKGGVGTQQVAPEFSVIDHGVAYFEKTSGGKEVEVASKRIATTGKLRQN